MFSTTNSPVLKFFSGPNFDAKPCDPAVTSGAVLPAEVEQSVKALPDVFATDSVFSTASYDSEDNVSVISEISTCSSAVTLETVDEAERGAASASGNKRRTPFKSAASPSEKAKTPSLSDSGINCPSSSDPEDVEDGRKLSWSKKPPDPFANGAAVSVAHSANGPSAGSAPEAEKLVSQPEASIVKKRRSSISRRLSPALSAFFSSGSHSGGGNTKIESGSRTDKEPKKSGGQVRLRKLSLTTMFHGKPAAEKETKKRRNTDPSLHAAQAAIANASVSESDQNNQESKTDTREVNNTEKNELEFFEIFLKEDDLKIRDLIEHVLRAHLLSMSDYQRSACDRAGRSISKILKTLVTSMKEAADEQCKVVCQVFIGAVKEEGILIATQAIWNSNNDNFAAASFRNDAVFGLAVVISTQMD